MTGIVELILRGDNRDLSRTLNQSGREITGFGKRAASSFTRIGKTIGNLSDRYLTRFNTLLGGAALIAAGKGVIDFDSNLARLSIQAELTKKEMFDLKNELFQVAAATHQAPTELLEGVNAIVERTGNFKFAIESLKSMGVVASATGASMADIGATASNLQEKMGITGDQVMEVFDVLSQQGKRGSFTLQNMASLFERLLSAAGRFEVKGVAGMRKFGAFLQIARRGTGTSEQAATAVERTISDLIAKADEVRGVTRGFSIFDAARSRQEGRKVMKDFDTVLKEIVRRTKGDTTKLQKIFGEESIRAITPLAQSFQKYGDFRELDRFVSLGGDGTSIMKDFAFWAEQDAASIGDFRTQISKIANENLAGPIEYLTKALRFLNEHAAVTKGTLAALFGTAGVLAIAKAVRGIGGVIAPLFGKGKGMAGAGGLGAGLSSPVPVYVVNRHLSMLPGKGWGFPEGAGGGGSGGAIPKAGGGAGALGKAARFAGFASLIGALGVGLGEGTTLLLDKIGEIPFVKKDEERRRAFLETHTWDQDLQKYIEREPAQPVNIIDIMSTLPGVGPETSQRPMEQPKNEITMNVTIHKDDRVLVETAGSTRANITAKRGNF